MNWVHLGVRDSNELISVPPDEWNSFAFRLVNLVQNYHFDRFKILTWEGKPIDRIYCDKFGWKRLFPGGVLPLCWEESDG